MEKNYKYKAFISYSRQDEKAARWLQRAVENYRLPRHLAASLRNQGRATALRPVFKDREDLHASSNLGDSLRRALAESEYLIVVCSPNAVASEWVNQEIAEFIRMRSLDRVLAVIVAGEPNAVEAGHRPDLECFPDPLKYELDADGSLTDNRREPLAPDLRDGGDGKRLVRLKLIASMLGVDLDQLVQREAQRRVQILGAVAIFALIIAGALLFMTLQTLRANQIAEARRNSAESLIEFMISDLRDQLEPVGRLAVLDSVGARALKYYEGLGSEHMNADSLGRRSRALLLLGEIQRGKGNLSGASAIFSQVAADTAALLAAEPGNTKRIFDHAQSTFWQGYIAWENLDFDNASTHLSAYRDLAQRLVDTEPDNVDWQLELHYAYSSMGALYYQQGEWDLAQKVFSESLNLIETILAAQPGNPEYMRIYAEEASWLASTYLASNQYSRSAEFNAREYDTYEQLLLMSPDDRTVESRRVTALEIRATLQLILGEVEQARRTLAEGEAQAASLAKLDPENADYWKSHVFMSARLALLHISTGSPGEAPAHLDKCRESGASLSSLNADSSRWLLSGYAQCRIAAVRYWLAKRDTRNAAAAIKALEAMHAELPAPMQSHRLYPDVTAEILIYQGDIANMEGDVSRAMTHWQSALAVLDTVSQLTHAQSHIRFDALVRLDDVSTAKQLGRQLMDQGYLHHQLTRSYATLPP
ncbi:toll/interleukin-1 receptor domain-containing protein [Seongchinamella unica]|uniref:Toll/interleukin-1 receptor domain-containing protein n=1 Tax=Seongchinamella unica TaxID=2547392 RepID=A0A4R5LNJ0_9GAMM|nr:toll/interleukin-1 receptor domain-containing protein [Seongchinamella unica]TDG11830.1 toll/interleukin-1 receptor domain-containing protein [Seongchinamella unica]